MRNFFVTDIHGDDEGIGKLFDHVAFNPAYDKLVVGGDMIDRGKDSGKVIKRIKFLCDNYPDQVKAVIGNHEEMMGWYLKGMSGMWVIHGGLEAIDSFKKVFPDKSELQEHLNWACSLPLFVEDETFMFAHAGLDPFNSLEEQSREVLWMTENEFYQFHPTDLLTLTKGKPIVHGHTPVERIIHDGARMNCDMGSQSYSVVEERGLGLVELNAMECFVYKPYSKKITTQKVYKYNQ